MDYYAPVTVEMTASVAEQRSMAGAGPLPPGVTAFISHQDLNHFFGLGSFGLADSEATVFLAHLVTPSLAETRKRSVSDTQLKVQSELESLAQRRATLLRVRRAMPNPPTEVLARLDILNERMRLQSPRVSGEQIAALEKAADLSDAVAARRRARMERLQNRR